MVVAVGDICFLEKSTESSLQLKKKKKRKMMLPPAHKLGTHLIPAHNGRALQFPKDDPKQALAGWTMPAAPLPAQESAVHSCSHVPKQGPTPAICLHGGRKGSHIFGITVLVAEKRPLLEQTPAGISQLTVMLHNCCVQGEEGNQIQTQKGKPSGNRLHACP